MKGPGQVDPATLSSHLGGPHSPDPDYHHHHHHHHHHHNAYHDVDDDFACIGDDNDLYLDYDAAGEYF